MKQSFWGPQCQWRSRSSSNSRQVAGLVWGLVDGLDCFGRGSSINQYMEVNMGERLLCPCYLKADSCQQFMILMQGYAYAPLRPEFEAEDMVTWSCSEEKWQEIPRNISRFKMHLFQELTYVPKDTRLWTFVKRGQTWIQTEHWQGQAPSIVFPMRRSVYQCIGQFWKIPLPENQAC